MRYFALVLVLLSTACSSQGQGLDPVSYNDAGTSTNTTTGTGTSTATTPPDSGTPADTQATLPDLGTAPSPDTKVSPPDTLVPSPDTLVMVPDTKAGDTLVADSEPQKVDPSPDSGVAPDSGTRTCGLTGQTCCKNQVCNVGLTCSAENSCVTASDAGTPPDTRMESDTFKFQFSDTKVREPDTQTDTRPPCGEKEQTCCLTNTEESLVTKTFLEMYPEDRRESPVVLSALKTHLAYQNCPNSAVDGYRCVTHIESDPVSGAPILVTRTCQKQ